MSVLKTATWNVNGIRSASQKGFAQWLQTCGADIVFLQEVRALPSDIPAELRSPFDYVARWNPAQKKGYSGVGIYTRLPSSELKWEAGLGVPELDQEGRVLTLVWKNFAFLSTYFPNSQREGVRLGYKLQFCEALLKHLKKLLSQKLHVVVAGDFNIAHGPLDLANPKSNEKNAGYLPEEREFMTKWLGSGFVDSFRHFEKGGGHYTWWSNRPGIRQRNIGWRLDSHIVSESLLSCLKSTTIQSDVFGSDHCPVELTFRVD